MSSGEVSFVSPPFLRVTWAIPDFFKLCSDFFNMCTEYSLQSPDFTFADGRYCLRLFPTPECGEDCIGIELPNSIDNAPGRAVLHEVQLKTTIGEIDMDRHNDFKGVFRIRRWDLENQRYRYVPDGTLTVLCSVLLRKLSGAGSPKSGGAQTRVIPKHRVSGKLSSQSPPFLYVTWRIPGCLQLSRESECTLESPEFSFSDRRYCLRLVWQPIVAFRLVNLTDTVPGRYVSYEIGLKSTTGEEIYIDRRGPSTTREFNILRHSLDCKKSECFPDSHLTVFCSIHSREPSSARSPKSGVAQTLGLKAPVPQTAIHPKSCGTETQAFPGFQARVSQAATHLKSVGVQTSNEEDKEGLPAFNKMLKDMKRLLASGENSDVTLVVGGKEFPVHRIILCARSPVFKAMLCHDTSERDSGTVSIEDCDPGGFQDFLTYVYTGSTGHIDTGNVISLYATSDKYLMSELKEACMSFMKCNVSVEGFCGIATLALRHEEKELIESATKFFCEHSKEIIETENWVTFLDENPKEAYEHFIKPSIRMR